MNDTQSLTNRSVLIVGGAGYIGSVMTSALLKSGAQVRVLDCFLYGNSRPIETYIGAPNFSFIFGDMGNQAICDRALEGITDVVLLASIVGDPVSKKYPDLTRVTNIDKSEALVRSLSGRGIRRLIFTSTCSNYGLRPTDEPAVETDPLQPLSLYAETKVAFESFLTDNASEFDFDPVIFRIATAFGFSPRMRFDLTVNEFAYHLAVGKPLDVYDKDTWRPYCHTFDVARAVIKALEADSQAVRGEVFNVGCDENNYTKEMIVEEIRRHIPEAKVTYVDKGFDRRNYRVSFSKIRSQLRFEPEFMVRTFIPELIAAVRGGVFAAVEQHSTDYGNYQVLNPDAFIN